MDTTSEMGPDKFPDLKRKLNELSEKLTEWNKLQDPGTTIDESDRTEALERINEYLKMIKSEINVFWGPAVDPDNEVRILIQDKHTNPWRKQVEDIEGDVGRMQGICRF